MNSVNNIFTRVVGNLKKYLLSLSIFNIYVTFAPRLHCLNYFWFYMETLEFANFSSRFDWGEKHFDGKCRNWTPTLQLARECRDYYAIASWTNEIFQLERTFSSSFLRTKAKREWQKRQFLTFFQTCTFPKSSERMKTDEILSWWRSQFHLSTQSWADTSVAKTGRHHFWTNTHKPRAFLNLPCSEGLSWNL